MLSENYMNKYEFIARSQDPEEKKLRDVKQEREVAIFKQVFIK